MKLMITVTMAAMITAASVPASDQIDESAMFGDTATLVDSAAVVNTATTMEEMKDRKIVGMSGDITSAMSGYLTRDWFDDPAMGESRLTSTIVGNLMLDARLLQAFKAFGNMEASYIPDSNKASLALRELFIDANIGKKVYFRTGKQVLQWGRCYFWNPTDLINVEKKSFLTKLGYREGTYGIRAHVPFGTAWNLYGFLDAHKAPRLDSLAGAAKVEFLVGGTEMSVSVWDKRGHKPVYGLDFSTQILKINIAGEIGLHQEYRYGSASYRDSTMVVTAAGPDGIVRSATVTQEMLSLGEKKKAWVPRVSLNVGRRFGVLGIQDRLTLNGEVYYNHIGSTDETVVLPMPSRLPVANLTPEGERLLRLQSAGYLLASGAYEPNSYSRWYAAFFGSLGRFITTDLTLTVNAMANLNQGCAMLTTGLAYTGLNDFSLGLTVNGFVGPENTEYTLAGDAMQVQATAAVRF